MKGEDIIIKNNINLSLKQMYDIIKNKRNYFPSQIYRYREINPNESIEDNKHVDALKKGKNYLTNPYYFNDPYDSAFSIDIEKFKNSLVKNVEKQLKKQILKKTLSKTLLI